MRFLEQIPEHLRGWFYLAAAVVLLVVLVALLVVDVLQGGDPGDWLTWIAGGLGFGSAAMAAANTRR